MPPKTPQHRRNGNPNASSTNHYLRYFWMIVTGVLGGFSTFVIYDRMYHAVEVNQLLVVSVDTMNVMGGGQLHQSVVDQVQQEVSKKPNNKRNKIITGTAAAKAVKEAVKDIQQAADTVTEQHAQKQANKRTMNRRKKNNEVKVEESNPPPVEAELSQQEKKLRKRMNKALTTTGPKPREFEIKHEVQPNDVVRSLSDNDIDDRSKVYFLNQTQVTHKDSFSASWLQSKKDFLDMKLEVVQICEDAAFKAWNSRKQKLRMTMDYFDFSVEHLSKWWKLLDYYESDIVYSSVYNKLEAYVQAGGTDYPTPSAEPILGETVVTIAFQPYKMSGRMAKNKVFNERSYKLTIVSLAATIESLRRAEMGRVVVVGSEASHQQYAQDAIDYLHEHLKVEAVGDASTKEQLVGHLEVAYVQATPEMTRTKHLARNMPKGALVGARKAFVLAENDDRTEEDTQFLNAWFGTGHDPKHWQYLYLTEPDSILTTRSSALSQIKEEIDVRGGIVSPFRLQPIPHESDIRGYSRKDRFLTEADGFETVLELDHYADSHDVCCDEHMGHDHRPGKVTGDECGHKKWFLCGFEEKVKTEDPHRRLRPYQLFRLTKGTGLTTIAGNLFGRRCFAGQNSVCRPPFVH